MSDLHAPSSGMPEKFYTIGEVARLLSVSRTTVYRWRLGSLKAVRVGGVVRVSESSLREFIADHNAREKQMGGA